MLTSMFTSLSESLGVVLDKLIQRFLSALGMELSQYLTYFPFLNNLYVFLRTLGVGLIVIIAGKSLATFWLGSLDSSYLQDRPANILLRSFIATVGVYFGGYILELVVKLGTIPFNDLVKAQAAINDSWSFGTAIADATVGIIGADVSETQGGADLVVALATFVITLLISFNLLKLMVEVAERYLMVGVLVFTSPVIYPTLATKRTTSMFQKWWSMFISAVIMMSVSVAFLKLIVNGMVHLADGNYLMRLLLVLAMCKIAQRADNYLGQLGLNTAITGGNMIDDILAMRRMLPGHGGGGKGGGAVLGAAGAIMSRTAGGQGLRAFKKAFTEGKNVKESFAAGKAAMKKAYDDKPMGGGIDAFNAARGEGKSVAASLGAGVVGAAKQTAPIAAATAAVAAAKKASAAGKGTLGSFAAGAAAFGKETGRRFARAGANLFLPNMMNAHDAGVAKTDAENLAAAQKDHTDKIERLSPGELSTGNAVVPHTVQPESTGSSIILPDSARPIREAPEQVPTAAREFGLSESVDENGHRFMGGDPEKQGAFAAHAMADYGNVTEGVKDPVGFSAQASALTIDTLINGGEVAGDTALSLGGDCGGTKAVYDQWTAARHAYEQASKQGDAVAMEAAANIMEETAASAMPFAAAQQTAAAVAKAAGLPKGVSLEAVVQSNSQDVAGAQERVFLFKDKNGESYEVGVANEVAMAATDGKTRESLTRRKIGNDEYGVRLLSPSGSSGQGNKRNARR